MKKMINRITINGLVYSNDLKMTKDNKYVVNTLSVLTSDPSPDVPVNTCDLHVIAGQRYGNSPDSKANPNFNILTKLMNEDKERTFLQCGKDAVGVSISGSLAGNYFLPRGQEAKRENMVSTVNNSLSFINVVDGSTISEPKATFETDILITQVVEEMTKATETMPAAPTGNYFVKGYIFDFRNTAIEVSYIAKKTDDGSMSAADYFKSLHTPVFTKVWGNINGFITTVEQTEESAFGAAKVVSFKNTKREYELTGALATPYEPSLLTEDELKQALSARELAISSALDRQLERDKKDVNVIGSPNIASASSFEGLSGSLGGQKFTF